MEQNAAAQHLQVIRTLMERAALYRRTLAPVMTFAGVVGLMAAGAGCWMQIALGRAFIFYWLVVAVLTLIGVSMLVRRQALKDREPFWSPPTRRVSQAMSPPLSVGLLLSLWAALAGWGDVGVLVLPVWMMLYGCALHAAGFFMPRGMRVFGWLMIAVGALVVVCLGPAGRLVSSHHAAHMAMGLSFGAMHLAYGIYLYFTEQRNKAA